MTRASLKAVGFCAWRTEVGDRALDYALSLARRHGIRLDIFIFPSAPTVPHPSRGRHGERLEDTEVDVVELERQVRLYYEDRLGDYIEVGFRVCLGDEAPELRRCLLGREADVLVLPYEVEGCRFGEQTIEAFARHMPCPVVLVGPVGDTELHVNPPAELWTTELELDRRPWQALPSNEETPAAPGSA